MYVRPNQSSIPVVHRLLTVITLAASLLLLPPPRAAHAATFVVDTTVDSNSASYRACTAAANDCSLRGAISKANAQAGDDTITLQAHTYTLTIAGTDEDANATGDLDVTSTVTIDGAGATLTIIQAGALAGAGIDRVFHIPSSAGNLTLDGVTLRYGKTVDYGGGASVGGGRLTLRDARVSDNSAHGGGGICADGGSLAIYNSTISGNGADSSGGGVINLYGSVTLVDSVLSGNSAGLYGGGLHSYGQTDITNSTISGNSAESGGGGLYVRYNTTTVTNSTVSGNSSDSGLGGGATTDGGNLNLVHCTVTDNSADYGGGLYIWSGDTANLKNTIVAGNHDGSGGADCGGSSATSLGYNLVGSGTGCPSDGAGDQTTSDPLLGTLADNGGPTWTHALLAGSPALDAIPGGANGCGIDTTEDQRGLPRPIGDACDVGAYEKGVAAVWDNGGGDGLWSTAANWADNAVPSDSSVVVFNDTSDANSGMDAAFTVAGVSIDADYGGVVSQGSYNLTVNGNWAQSGGTFNGGSGALDLTGAFNLSGGEFTAPAGLMTVSGGFHHTGGSFDPNGGRVVLDNTTDQTLATTFSDLVLNDGLLGYWKLDEGSGTTARDGSGYGHDGTLANGPAWTSATVGGIDFHDPAALSFDGDNDYVDIAGTSEIDNLQQFTLAAWVQLASLPAGNMRFITLRNEKAVLRYDDQALDIYVTIDGGVQHVLAAGALGASGAWVHVAGTYDGTTLRAYLNGTEQPGAVSVSGTVNDGAGIHLSSEDETLDGLLDDVRVYSRALSAAEIGDLAQGKHPQTAAATTTLVANLNVDGDLTLNSGGLSVSVVREFGYWKFDEGSGLTTADASGNGHAGTLSGGPTWTTDTAPTSFSNPFALAFDGVDDRVLIDAALARPRLAFTYALWFKPANAWDAASSRKDLLYGQSGARPAVIFNRDGDGKIGLYTTIGGVDQNSQLTTITAWTAGTWYHLAFTWDGSQVLVYVNGVQEGDPYAAAGTHSASSGMSIAADPDGARPADALIDDVRVYDQALTASQVQTLAEGDVLPTAINVGGDFIRNGGVFTPGAGLVTFDAAGMQILDTDAITFHDVTVKPGATLLTRRNFVADGVLSNDGALQQTRNVTSGGVAFLYTGGYGGLSISGTNLGDTTVTIRGNQDCTATPDEPVRRCFDIAPAAPTGSARVQFYFAAGELAGNTCDTLNAYRWDGSAWQPLTLDPTWGGDGRVCESEPYSVRVYPVTAFGPFVLKNPAQPQAVTGLAASDEDGALRLDWTAVTRDLDGYGLAGVTYSVYRGVDAPFFEAVTPYAGGITDAWWTDPEVVIGDPAHSYFYLVRAVASDLTSDDSYRVGTFAFGLTPGN